MALPGSEYRLEYEVGKEKRTLHFVVPDYFSTSKVRARFNYVLGRWISTEIWKRIDAAHDGDTISTDGCSMEDYEAREEWQTACLEETIACVSGLEVGGVPDERSIEEIRTGLRNDVLSHQALRIARIILFLNAGETNTRDAE